jgi:hypothetical protein
MGGPPFSAWYVIVRLPYLLPLQLWITAGNYINKFIVDHIGKDDYDTKAGPLWIDRW